MKTIARIAYHNRIMSSYLGQKLAVCFEDSDIDSLFTIFYADGSCENFPGNISEYVAVTFETEKYDSIGYELRSGRTVVQKVTGSRKELWQHRFDTFYEAVEGLIK